MSYGSSNDNFIKIYEERVKDYNSPEGFEAWVSHLRNLEASQIEWTLGWLPVMEVIHMTATKGYLLLMGLRSVQPYAPQRVLRHLGRYQVVPEDADLSTQVIELHLEATLLEALVQQDWNGCRYLQIMSQSPSPSPRGSPRDLMFRLLMIKFEKGWPRGKGEEISIRHSHPGRKIEKR